MTIIRKSYFLSWCPVAKGTVDIGPWKCGQNLYSYQESVLSFHQEGPWDQTQVLMLVYDDRYPLSCLGIPSTSILRQNLSFFLPLRLVSQAYWPSSIWAFLLSVPCLGYRCTLSHVASPLCFRDLKLDLQVCAASTLTHWAIPPLNYSFLMFWCFPCSGHVVYVLEIISVQIILP